MTVNASSAGYGADNQAGDQLYWTTRRVRGMALAKHQIYQYNYIAYKQHIEIMTDEQ